MTVLPLWGPLTLDRPFVRYAWLLLAVPVGLGVIAKSSTMAFIGLLVTIGMTPTMLALYFGVAPLVGEPRTTLQRGLFHVMATVTGSAVGCVPAVVVWSMAYGYAFDVVYLSVLRITLVITAIVVAAVVAVDAAARPAEVGLEPTEPDEPFRLTARHNGTLYVVDPRDVSRLYAADKYVAVKVDGRELLLDESLTALDERLSPLGFVRTHRGELVNRHHVRALEGSELVLSDGQRARVSRRAIARVRSLLLRS